MRFNIVKFTDCLEGNTLGVAFIVYIFYSLLCYTIFSFWMGLLGCSGDSETKSQKPAVKTVKAPPAKNLHSASETAQHHQPDGDPEHTHTQEVSTPPMPSNLGLEGLNRRVSQKHPSLMTEMEIEYVLHEAVMLAETDVSKAQEKMHEIAQTVGSGDPDWTEYLHLLGHSLIESPRSSPNLYMSVEDALRFKELQLKLYGESAEVRQELERTQLVLQFNRDRTEVSRQIEPIGDVLSWMEEHAKNEWEIVNPLYKKVVEERVHEFFPYTTDWLDPDERADIRYEAFFDALERLPDDSVTLQTMFESDHNAARNTLLSNQDVIQAEPPSSSEPRDIPTHTWDMGHETWKPIDNVDTDTPTTNINPVQEAREPAVPGEVADLEKTLPTTKNLETAFQEQFNSERLEEALSILERHGTEEGLRRLKSNDPEIAEEIEKRLRSR